MTERERFIKALKRQPIDGHCPTFELEFFLTLEALGRIHHSQQHFSQWGQMSPNEKKLHFDYVAETYIKVAEKYHHSAIFIHPNNSDVETTVRILEAIREKTGDEYYIMMHGDPTFSMPDGDNMLDFTERLYEDEAGLKAEALRRTEESLRFAEELKGRGNLLDGFALCSDYCFNVNPFFTPEMFSVYIAPYLEKVISGYHDMGYTVIKHTDGNIMPIVDQMVDCAPDALHSLDPQGGVSLSEVKRLYGDRVALCGNVNCGLLQTGSDEDVINDVRRSLKEGMDGFGYIFCTSNCAYTGLSLERYELMNRIWWEEGIY